MGKALLGLGNERRQNCMIGIGIGRYKPSGLRDWEKILVGIVGLKNPIGDPPYSLIAVCLDMEIKTMIL